jgi:hypothetical protein
MATATKPRTSPLEKIKAAEVAWAEARDAASAAAREHGEQARLAQGLTDKRRRLVHADPELILHTREAADPDNPVGKIDRKLGKLDVEDAAAKNAHARELERVARQRFEDLVKAHGAALEESRRPEGEALLSEFSTKAAALADVADQLLAYGQRSVELAGVRKLSTQQIPIDGIADAARATRQLAEHPPALPVHHG